MGIVGVGRIGAFHLRTLLGLAQVERVTVADADPSLARTVASAAGAEAAESPDELLAADPDAVVIATATAGHVPLIRAAATAGVPAFCEKPVATELAALDELIADPALEGAYIQIGFQRRFDAGYVAAREVVASGGIGRLLVVRAATHDPAPPSEAYIAGSGGIFRDLHIHDFDAIRFVTGEEIVEVYADGAVRETPWFADHHDFDAAAAAMRLSGGALAILSGARHDAFGYDVRLEVFGTGDSVSRGRRPALTHPVARARSASDRGSVPDVHGEIRERLPGGARRVRHRGDRGPPEPMHAFGRARRTRRRACRGPLAGRASSRPPG